MNEQINKAILLFAKIPELNVVKTRLQSQILSNYDVLQLYEAFLLDTFYQSHTSKSNSIIFSLTNSKIMEKNELKFEFFEKYGIFNLDRVSKEYHYQPKGSFGKRMKDAIKWVFERNVEHLIILGADSPQIQPQLLDQCFNDLDKYDIVLGPSPEGGIYLIGINMEFPLEGFQGLFDGVELSNFAEYVVNHKLNLKVLPELTDIDTEADLVSLIAWIDIVQASQKNSGTGGINLPKYTIKAIKNLNLVIKVDEQNNRNKSIAKSMRGV